MLTAEGLQQRVPPVTNQNPDKCMHDACMYDP